MALRSGAQGGHMESVRAEHVIIASNRGPFEYNAAHGDISFRPGPGGLVTALTRAADLMGATWVAMAMSDGDRKALALTHARYGPDAYMPAPEHAFRLRQVAISPSAYKKYYETISNEYLWFTFSHMHDLATRLASEETIVDAWETGYRVANQAIADAVVANIEVDSTAAVVMLQDCFLFLAPAEIRVRCPSVLMQHFLHWPWPDARYLALLPSYMTTAIYRGLLGNDIIGLQSMRDVHNFLDGASLILEDALVDYPTKTIQWRGRHILVEAYPVSISVVDELAVVQSQAGLDALEQLQPYLDMQVIMRVDRMDPMKNAIAGFEAYALLLEEHAELRGQVVFLAFLVPTREQAASYQHYASDLLKAIGAVNERYGTDRWQPICAFVGNDRVRALAALQEFDVLLINPTVESMNLVAKEGAVLNRRNGILALSRTAGSFNQLRQACLPLSPTNQREIADVLYRALRLPQEERAAMAALARERVRRHDLNEWLNQQIRDINTLINARSPGNR